MRKLTLAQKGHLLTAQNRQKALDGNLLNGIMWNWKIKIVGYGFLFYMMLVRLLAGRVGFYLIWALVGNRCDMETILRDRE